MIQPSVDLVHEFLNIFKNDAFYISICVNKSAVNLTDRQQTEKRVTFTEIRTTLSQAEDDTLQNTINLAPTLEHKWWTHIFHSRAGRIYTISILSNKLLYVP